MDLSSKESPSSTTNNAAPKTKTVSKRQSVPKKRGKNMTHPQLRGFNQLWERMMVYRTLQNGSQTKLTNKEKMNNFDKFKEKMLLDYEYVIVSGFLANKKKYERHSTALAYLQYKNDRQTNLDASELSKEQYSWYKELGGQDNIALMLAKQDNICSISKVSSLTRTRRRNKKRKLNSCGVNSASTVDLTDNIATYSIASSPSSQSHNHNRQEHRDGSSVREIDDEPPNKKRKKLLKVKKEKINVDKGAALKDLHIRYTAGEITLLEKRKKETKHLCEARMTAMATYARKMYSQSPELIGAHGLGQGTMTLADQQNVAFTNWISEYKHEITTKIRDVTVFLNAVADARQDRDRWFQFTDQMISFRIMNGNDFEVVWPWVFDKLDLQLPLQLNNDPFSDFSPLSSEEDVESL